MFGDQGMSRTIKKDKPVGFDYWSRRCFGCEDLPSEKVSKWITKRKERLRNKKMFLRIKDNIEDYDKRFAGE